MQITKARLKQIIQEEFARMEEITIAARPSTEPITVHYTHHEEASMGQISEDGHTDVSSAIRSMKLIIEDAGQILEGLMQISKEGELPSWWMNKVAVAKKDLNSCRDYFLVSEEKRKKFPDLTGDGKVTQADILKGRGVIDEQESQISDEEFQDLYKKLLDDIKNSDRLKTDDGVKYKLEFDRILRDSDLGKRFKSITIAAYDKVGDDAREAMPKGSSVPPRENAYGSAYGAPSTSYGPYGESQSLSDDLLETLIRKQLQKKTKISEALSLHIKEGVGIERNIFRPGSDSYFALISEARRQYKNGDYSPINEEEAELLESDVGEFGIFEGEKVPLDFPMINEAEYKGKKVKIGKPTKNTGGGKKYKVFVRNPKTGNVKKITYGDSKGGLKGNWNNAEARASFAARHNCADKKDRTKAGYWACRAHKHFGKNVPGRFW